MQKTVERIKNYFQFKERSATFKKEIIGGLSTFLAMAYILAVNPGMLSNAGNFTSGKYVGVFFLGTVIVSFVGTIAMGLFANIPIAVAPGMGVNAFFTYTVAGSILNLTLEQALIATFVSGLLYAVIAITPLRHYIAKLLPKNMKLAIGAMIGLFLAYIGLVNSGIIVSGAIPAGPKVGISTATKLGNLKDHFVLASIFILLLAFILHFMKVKGAAILSILAGVLLLGIFRLLEMKDTDKIFQIKSYKSFSKFGELSSGMWSSIGSAFSNGRFYIAIFVFLYIDFFDTTGTLFTIGQQAKLNKNKEEADKWLKQANIVDAGSTILGSVMLTSTATSYTESSVGVSQGARTGFASIITGLGFLLSLALWPIMSPILPIKHLQDSILAQSGTIMPVTGPILVLVGSLMISQLKFFDWSQTIDIPVLFATLVFGMLSYTISTGIAAGIIIYYLINAAALLMETYDNFRKKKFRVNDLVIVDTGKVDSVKTKNPNFKLRVCNPIMIAMFILAVVYFATMPLYAY